MEKPNSTSKSTSKERQLVMDAIVIEQSKLELTVALQNILEYYLQLFTEIAEAETHHQMVLDNLVKCHVKLKQLFTNKKKLLNEDTKTMVKELIMESETISKVLAAAKAPLAAADIHDLFSSKRYTIEYKILSLKNNLYTASMPQTME
ncbi:MAG: hypothetical protein JW795_05740 [Chitinivibrionales bacterium]|nr:hypothetical protein [Chitinivibrionales bacterium]